MRKTKAAENLNEINGSPQDKPCKNFTAIAADS